MDTITIVICACCALNFFLLLVLLYRTGKGDDIRAIRSLEKEFTLLNEKVSGLSRELPDQAARQNQSTSAQITGLENELREDLGRIRRETGDSLREINGIVTEKMQSLLDRKLKDAFDTVNNLGTVVNQSQERQRKATEERLNALETEFGKIRTEIQNALDKVRTENAASLDKLRAENTASLDKLRVENTASLDKLQAENRDSMDRINATVNEKLQKTLNDRISQSFEAVNQRLTQVYEGLGEMKSVASGVSELKNVLSNVKNRGIVGEIQLSAILADILSPEQYESQFRLDPEGQEMVDFAVRLPGMEEGEYVYLPIDSKFPGDTYALLAAAYDAGDPELLKRQRAALDKEIRRCAKSIRDKYIQPPRTTDFAILFLPFEGLYAEVVNMGLVEPLQREYRVNVSGPSTMAAMLNSLQMGFRTLAIQKKSGEVWKILEAAKKEFAAFEEVLSKTRYRLRQADDELDRLIGTRTRAINRKLKDVASLDASEDAGALLE